MPASTSTTTTQTTAANAQTQARKRKPQNGSSSNGIGAAAPHAQHNGRQLVGEAKAEGFRMDEAPLMFRVLAHVRVPMLMFVVIPLSFGLWCFRTARSEFRKFLTGFMPASLCAALGTHEERVAKIAKQLQQWNDDGCKKKLRTSRANWLSMSTRLLSNKQGCHLIDVSELNHILEYDEKEQTVTVEPMVTFGQLTEFLMPKGMCMQCHIEMESITVGGASMGFGLETNSHKVGFFQETVVEYELVTPDAKVHRVTAESDPELFYALPWSYGTIGFLTKVKCRVVKAKPYVHVTYIPTFSAKELSRKLNELANQESGPDFLEATGYSKDNAVIQCARFADVKEWNQRARVNHINWFWKPFYYKWVETALKKGQFDEYIPTKHYYHRFTRSIFWELEDMIPFSNHPLYRVLWGWMGAPEVSLLKLFQGPVIRKSSMYAHAVQESIVPLKILDEGIEKFDDWYGIYPLLIFPVRVYDRGDLSGMLRPRKDLTNEGKDYGIWVDIGAYGVPRAIKEGKSWSAKKNVRDMEHWTRDNGGWQALYTDIFCTEKELRSMFDHTLLEKARKRLGSEKAFGSVYSKVRPEPGLLDLSDVLAAEEKEENVKCN
eukprot:CAMPEP_0114509854 /NCGR_PEP_ID=MMETSP0109-20121206/13449_1 /TAXON_ID=29199 /ORGANISM="Chlorarachnion reptans, Strain CCCM449" /LENGTH=603 /DNA_ID=CAMNT_0001689069 /DNA_START=290 /DNA_END=2101 /DNA_ORIENTATION=+